MKLDTFPRFPADSRLMERKLTDLFRDIANQVNLTPPGSTGQITYNSDGVPGASSNFTYDSATNTVSFGSITGSALAMTIQPRAPTVLENGGTLTLRGRDATAATRNGGAVIIQSGAGQTTGLPGNVSIRASTSGTTTSSEAVAGVYGGTPTSTISSYSEIASRTGTAVERAYIRAVRPASGLGVGDRIEIVAGQNGDINVTSGVGLAGSNAGSIVFSGGAVSSGVGNGGGFAAIGGDSLDGIGGPVDFFCGSSGTGQGGAVSFTAGNSGGAFLGGGTTFTTGSAASGSGSHTFNNSLINPILQLSDDGANSTIGLHGVSPVAQSTGWGSPTGTATKTAFATGTVTTSQLAERVKAIIDYLKLRGDFGA